MTLDYLPNIYRIARWIFSFTASVVSACLFLGMLTISTTTGFYILLFSVKNLYQLPVAVGEVKGNLLRGLVIKQASYQQYIVANETHISWGSPRDWSVKISIDELSLAGAELPGTLSSIHKLVHPVIDSPHSILINLEDIRSYSENIKLDFTFYNHQYHALIHSVSSGIFGELSSDDDTKTNFQLHPNQLSIDGAIVFKKQPYQVHMDLAMNDILLPIGKVHISHPDTHIDFESKCDGHATYVNSSIQTPNVNIFFTGSQDGTLVGSLKANGNHTRLGNLALQQWQINATFNDAMPQPLQASLQADNLQIKKFQFDNVDLRYSQANLDFNHPRFTFDATSKSLFFDNIFLIDHLHTHVDTEGSSLVFTLASNYDYPFYTQWQVDKHAGDRWIAKPSQFNVAGSGNILEVLPETIAEFSSDYVTFKSNTKAKNYPLTANMIYYFGSSLWLEVALSDFPVDLLPLSLLQVFDLYPTNFSGLANGHFTLSKPDDQTTGVLDGEVRVKVDHGVLNQIVSDLPLATDLFLSSAETTLSLHGDNIDVHTEAKANDGTLQMIGNVQIDYFNPQHNFNIKGQNVRFKQPNDGFITIDSDINIQYQNGINSTNGQINIVEASYHNQQWKTALRLTDDVSVVSADIVSSAPVTPTAYNLKIDFGKQAMLHAFGFHGLVLGDLHLQQKPNDQRFLAEGSLYMKDGILLIYGQQLPLAQCRLNWYQSLLNKPHLDMQIRQNSTSTSLGGMQEYGINIAGNIDDLKVDFHSDPRAMSNVEILTHLLLDKHQYHREYTESIDTLLEDLDLQQINGNDISIVLEVLASIKRAMFFDRIELDSSTDTSNSGTKYEEMEILLTRMISERFALSMRLNSSDPRKNQFGFDAILSKEFRLRSYFAQNPSNLNFELYYETSS